MLAGLASLAAGQLVLSRLTDDSAYLTQVLPGLILTPFGGALVFPAVSVGMTSAVTAVDRGLAAGSSRRPSRSAARSSSRCWQRSPRARPAHGSLVEGYRTSYLVAAGFIVVTGVFVAFSSMRPASA